MFKNTISIIEECKIDWIHVFPYSSRIGTPASRCHKSQKKNERAEILRKISSERLNKHLNNKIGVPRSFREKNAKGFTEDYSRYLFLKVRNRKIIEMK